MEEKAAETAAAAAAVAVAGDLDGLTYCSEHPYPPGAAPAAGVVAGGGGICAFCLQEKLGMLVSSSKSSPFHPPPAAASPSSPPSNRAASEPPPPPLHSSIAARTAMSAKAKTLSSSAAPVAGGLKRSKSVAPRPEDPPLPPAPSAITANSPRKKSFWSFLYSSSSGGHQSASSSLPGGGGAPSERRKSVSVASASALGQRLEAIVEPESPGRHSEGSSSSFGRKVARSRSVGCGSRSFSGDFLERISTGFGDCALRRVESHREPKPKAGALGHLGGAHDAGDGDGDGNEDDYDDAQHRIKCAGFFGGLGSAPTPAPSSYWLSAADGASGRTRAAGARTHRSWAWALASPMRALRPASSSSSNKTIMAAAHDRAVGNTATMTAFSASVTAPSAAVATS